ncbi:MAG: FtsX-like permease family protein, partial [Acidobacteria bacterium]|nr:FtsX-like permease family protein [Acidobacteriota bacterium]
MKFFRRQQREAELDAEIRNHLDEAIRDRIERGESPDEARLNAQREFGNVGLVKEVTRAMWGWAALEGLLQDLRFGVRMLRKNPGFSFVAILTLALGIGAVAVVYSVMMTVLVQPLPYQNADRLVWLANLNPSLGGSPTFLNPEDILDYQEQAQSFEQIASWGTNPVNLYGGNKPERVESIFVTTNFFRTLGITPLLGRDFTSQEGKEGSRVAIISYGLWQRRFGGDPAVIGREIIVSSATQYPLTIVGVMPAEMNFPVRVDLFDTYLYERSSGRGGSHNDRTIARLKPGVTIAQAQAEISAIAARQSLQFPETNQGWDVQVIPFREHLFGSANRALPLLFGAALFVLLIAWTNIANLQLVRAAARQKEIAVRLALGASRWQIVRQLLTESLLLASGGALFGLLLAMAGINAVRAFGLD